MSDVDPENDEDRNAAPERRADSDRRVESEPEDLPSANEILGSFFGEASLWPLLVVVLGSTGAFGAALIVLALGDQNPFAAAALLLILAMTTDTLIRARRRIDLRNLAKLIALFWVVSIALATVAVISGIA
jgi:uncharacterized membrane protein YjjP (DUF1212 family)